MCTLTSLPLQATFLLGQKAAPPVSLSEPEETGMKTFLPARSTFFLGTALWGGAGADHPVWWTSQPTACCSIGQGTGTMCVWVSHTRIDLWTPASPGACCIGIAWACRTNHMYGWFWGRLPVCQWGAGTVWEAAASTQPHGRRWCMPSFSRHSLVHSLLNVHSCQIY